MGEPMPGSRPRFLVLASLLLLHTGRGQAGDSIRSDSRRVAFVVYEQR